MKDKILVGWSGGKDCALALYELARQETVEIAALLTTVTEGYERISMHGVRRTLLAAQAGSLGYRNRPLDHANFFPGVGTSAKRDNELSINLAEVDLTVAPRPIGFWGLPGASQPNRL